MRMYRHVESYRYDDRRPLIARLISNLLILGAQSAQRARRSVPGCLSRAVRRPCSPCFLAFLRARRHRHSCRVYEKRRSHASLIESLSGRYTGCQSCLIWLVESAARAPCVNEDRLFGTELPARRLCGAKVAAASFAGMNSQPNTNSRSGMSTSADRGSSTEVFKWLLSRDANGASSDT